MLRDRHEIDKFFLDILALTSELDPVLAHIDVLLDDDELYQRVRGDFARRYPKTLQTGRNSTPVEVVLRVLVVKHLYGWSYAETEKHVRDSLVLRHFCRVYFERVPDEKTLLRWANLLQPETLISLNAHVLQLASRLKITRGRKLRTDGTVVETNIRYPTDNGLLADGVRVLGRTLRRAKTVLGDTTELTQETFRNRSRSARKYARQVANQARRRSETAKAQLTTTYRKLLQVARQSVQQAKIVLEQLQTQKDRAAQRLTATLETFTPRVEQVISQCERRVFAGESVPASEKLVSLFEPHTAIIRRNKVRKPTEFGRKVWLDEVDGGLLSNWRVLAGNPNDVNQWQPALDQHTQQFGCAPEQVSGDRGLYSPGNEAYARALGVARVILPKPGHKSKQRRAHEKQLWFRRGRRYHAGVEGRISVLKRRYRLDRCRNRGEAGFHRWVGLAILAANLNTIGTKLAAKAT